LQLILSLGTELNWAQNVLIMEYTKERITGNCDKQEEPIGIMSDLKESEV